jgi:hypothetical protein
MPKALFLKQQNDAAILVKTYVTLDVLELVHFVASMLNETDPKNNVSKPEQRLNAVQNRSTQF